MTAAARSLVVLHLGDRSLDVAIPRDLAVDEVLRAAGVDVDDPSVTIVDSLGRQVDPRSTTGDQLADGSVLHVLVRTAQSRDAAAGGAVRDPALARPTTPPWWLGVAGAGAVVLAATVGLDGSENLAAGYGAIERWVLAAVLLVAAGALAVQRRHSRAGGSLWPVVVGALAGLAGGAATVDPALRAAGQLMIVAGLVAATTVTAVCWAVARRAKDPVADLSGVLLVTLATVSAVAAVVLLAGLPGSFAAAVLLGAVPLALRAMPTLCVDVPDEQLLDVAEVARTATAVRAPHPEPLGPVNDRMVHRSVVSGERRRDIGTVLVSLIGPVVAPIVLVGADPDAVTGSARVVVCALVIVVLALLPRTTRGALARWAPRVCATVLVLELCALTAVSQVIVGTLAALAVGLLVVAVSLPIGRGWRSVGFSRLADIVEKLATVLALPAALVAAGAIQVFRAAASG